MSLTDAEGNEIFQFSTVKSFKGDALNEIEGKAIVDSRIRLRNISALFEKISENSDSPMIMQTVHGRVYGVLYPMVRLEIE